MTRNLIEHPITMNEVKQVVDTAYQRQEDDDAVGGLDGYILGRIYVLLDSRFTAEDFAIEKAPE